MQQSGTKTAFVGSKARFAFATVGAALLVSCVVYTPDLLDDDAVSLGGGSPATPAQAPTSVPQLQLAWAAPSNAASADDREGDAGGEGDSGDDGNFGQDGPELDAGD